jgi:N-acetylglucosaminyl-diphospho-decaprenol L-rhamnosyltransferase
MKFQLEKMGSAGKVTVSIISHGNMDDVKILLDDLSRHCDEHIGEIILTKNLYAEDIRGLRKFENRLWVIENTDPRGFGENHNQAAKNAKFPLFCVLNPDIRINTDILSSLVNNIADASVAAVAPIALNRFGVYDFNARRYPSLIDPIIQIVKKFGLWKYKETEPSEDFDWLAGCFILFDKMKYMSVGGFDEKFFMYLEDVDICRRLRDKGFELKLVNECYFIHNANRASKKNIKYFYIHLKSYAFYFYKWRFKIF